MQHDSPAIYYSYIEYVYGWRIYPIAMGNTSAIIPTGGSIAHPMTNLGHAYLLNGRIQYSVNTRTAVEWPNT